MRAKKGYGWRWGRCEGEEDCWKIRTMVRMKISAVMMMWSSWVQTYGYCCCYGRCCCCCCCLAGYAGLPERHGTDQSVAGPECSRNKP